MFTAPKKEKKDKKKKDKSPSDFWRERLGFFSGGDDYYDGYGYSYGNYTGFFFSRGGPEKYAGYRGGWNPESEKKHRLNKVTHQVARTLNLVKNADDGEEKDLILSWESGEEKVNDPSSKLVYLSQNRVLNYESEHDNESVDVLTGQCLMLSAMKATMSQKAYDAFFSDGSEHADDTKLLFRAVESVVAKNEVLKDWTGFRPYFDCYEERTLSTKENVQEYVDFCEPSAEVATLAWAWNIQHQEDKLTLPEIYETAIEAANKYLDTEATQHHGRYDECKEAVKILYEMIIPPPSPPPPDSDESDNDVDKKENNKENEAKQEENNKENKAEPEKKDPQNIPAKPKVVDNQNFGGSIEDQYNIEIENVNINDNKDDDDPTNNYSYYNPPDKNSVELQGVSVARLSPTDVGIIKYNELVKELKPQIEAVKKVLNFRNAVCKIDEHGAPEGDLDGGSLHKFATGTDTIWTTTTETYKPELAVCLLIDQSGSMGYTYKYQEAQKVAIILTEALKSIRGVSLTVLGYTGGDNKSGQTLSLIKAKNKGLVTYEVDNNTPHLAIYEYVSKGHVKKEQSILSLRPEFYTPMGYAIEYAARRMAKDYPNTKKVVFHITDGLPELCSEHYTDQYGGEKARKHTKNCCDISAAKYQTPVYGIGFGPDFTSTLSETLFGAGKGIKLDNISDSIVVLTTFLKQILNRM